MFNIKAILYLYTGLAALAAGLLGSPALAETERGLPVDGFEYRDRPGAMAELTPEVKKEVASRLEKRKAGYRNCAVQANACARHCGLKYNRKVPQELCFKARRCRENWEACIAGVQQAYPVDGIETISKP